MHHSMSPSKTGWPGILRGWECSTLFDIAWPLQANQRYYIFLASVTTQELGLLTKMHHNVSYVVGVFQKPKAPVHAIMTVFFVVFLLSPCNVWTAL
jgi:hypothetical protein